MTLRRLRSGIPLLPRVVALLLARLRFIGHRPLHCVSGIGSLLSYHFGQFAVRPDLQNQGVGSAFTNTSRCLPALVMSQSWHSTPPRVHFISRNGMSVLVSGSSSLYHGMKLITEVSSSRKLS